MVSFGEFLGRRASFMAHQYSYDGLTSYRAEYLRGYEQALYDVLESEHLEWRISYRGALVLSADILPGTWHECQAGGAFVWRADPTRVWSAHEGAGAANRPLSAQAAAQANQERAAR